MAVLNKPIEFEWDEGNNGKNWRTHKVTDEECEEVFFDEYKTVSQDKLHSLKEERYVILGQTKKQRLLYIAFTIRKNKIRVISARDLNNKERSLYQP